VQIVPLAPDSAVEHLDGWVELYSMLVREQVPEIEPPTRTAALAELISDADAKVEALLAWDGGQALGAMTASMWLREDQHRASVDMVVRPELRRRGIGSRLADVMTGVLQAAGRECASADVADRQAGLAFSSARGARETLRDVRSRLDLTTVDAGWLRTIASAVPDPYSIAAWVDRCPEDLVDGVARAQEAMNDRPTGTGRRDDLKWDAGRVRALEIRRQRRGLQALTLAAVHGPSGDVAGFTEIVVAGAEATGAWQEETAVIAAHRGHGLGLVIKAANLLRLLDAAPRARWVVTWNAADNGFMRAVNERLGYAVCEEWVEVEADLRVTG
jgi:GNAT superfamily N-acetyltransferase